VVNTFFNMRILGFFCRPQIPLCPRMLGSNTDLFRFGIAVRRSNHSEDLIHNDYAIGVYFFKIIISFISAAAL
jgi:hypothetical protein